MKADNLGITLGLAAEYGLLRHLNGKTFVLTGTMSTKRDLITLVIYHAGGAVQSAVSSKTDFLVTPAGPVKFSKKTDDAYKYGVTVIDEDVLTDMLLPTPDELERGIWATPPFD